MVPREQATQIALRLSGWANQMVVRFGEGTHVYLVGSYLTSDTPRDLDISIVVPDDLFWRRYRDDADVDRLSEQLRRPKPAEGETVIEDWNVHGEWTPDMLRWGRESANLAANFFRAWANLGVHAGGGWPMDLKVMPLSEMNSRHKDCQRLQMDTIPAAQKAGP